MGGGVFLGPERMAGVNSWRQCICYLSTAGFHNVQNRDVKWKYNPNSRKYHGQFFVLTTFGMFPTDSIFVNKKALLTQIFWTFSSFIQEDMWVILNSRFLSRCKKWFHMNFFYCLKSWGRWREAKNINMLIFFTSLDLPQLLRQ